MASNADSLQDSLDKTLTILTALVQNPTPTLTIGPETYDMAGYLSAITQAIPVLTRARQDLARPFCKITRLR